MEDQRRRSIVKAVSWRVLATLTTMTIVFAFTGELALSLGVGVIEVMLKMVLYYGHERLWSRMAWGRASNGSKGAESVPEKTYTGLTEDR